MGDRLRRACALALAVSCATAVARAGSHQIPAVPNGTGAITGTVVDAGTGRPIAGAVVAAVMQLTVQGGGTAISGVNRQVTDAAGRFAFTKLPAADFTVQASRLGYFDGGYGQASLRAGGRLITLANGEWFPNVTIKLSRHASIAGTVVDEIGEPVVGAWVRVLSQVLISGETQWVPGPVTKTDDRGMYRFAGLTPGRWIVMVPSVQTAVPIDTSVYAISGLTPEGVAFSEAAGRRVPLSTDAVLRLDNRYGLVLGQSPSPPPLVSGRQQVYPITFHPSSRSLGDAALIDTSHGDDRTGVDVALRPLPAVNISGRLDGSPDAIEGMLLRLLPAGSENLGRGHEAATTIANADGTFAFLNVAPGAYTIEASRVASGYIYNPSSLIMTGSWPSPPGLVGGGMSSSAVFAAPPGTMFETHSQNGTTAFAGRARVEVADVALTDVVVRLTKGIAITGRVVLESSAGATDSSRPGFLSLIAEPAGGEAALGQRRFNPNRNDPSLAFQIQGLQSGEYLIRAAGGGLIKSIVHDGRDYTYTPFDTSTGQDISEVVITFTDQIARAAGTVRDAQNRPLTSNAAVICFPVERAQWSRYGLQPPRLQAVLVGKDATYRLNRLPAGDYFLIAVDEAYLDAWKDPKFLEKAAPAAQRVTLGWGDAKTQDLPLVTVR